MGEAVSESVGCQPEHLARGPRSVGLSQFRSPEGHEQDAHRVAVGRDPTPGLADGGLSVCPCVVETAPVSPLFLMGTLTLWAVGSAMHP